MILVTHGAGGALVAALLPSHPLLGSVLAFGSHFVLDAIPHWHYPRHTLIKQPDGSERFIYHPIRFVLDVVTVGADGILGILLPILIASPGLVWPAFLGACWGIFPDFLQFLYYALPSRPLSSLQRFHMWIHATLRFDDRPFVGIGSQALLFVCLLIALRLL